MTTEQFIIKKLSDGFLQPEISKEMKALAMKPNSLSYIEKAINSLKKEHKAKTNFQLAVILMKKGRIKP